ncbi:MAG: class I SAM-dependent methyltransferase [Candidatus Methylacidiphilales bacterium]|nr:class I SAM-dependent methyltransferase [Candidatus Methylacidiphilales bacterium]
MNWLHRAWEAIDYRFIRGPRGGGKPVPQEFLDREYRSGAWDHFWGEDEKNRHLVLTETILATPGTFSLLDLGCGSGRLASMIPAERVSDYLGVDLSEEGLAKSRALGLGHCQFLRANYESWNPERAWNFIVFNESLGYAVDPAATARRFHRHLAPGGRLLVSHFRWGNHAAFWKRLGQSFTFPVSREVANPQGQIWDIRELQAPGP